LLRLRDAVVDAGRIADLDFKGMTEERKPVFAGGVAVLRAAFETLGIEHMQVSDYALREGLIYEMMGRSRHVDVRERTIATLSRQFQIDQAHGRQVEATALALLRQVAQPWCLDEPRCPRMLSWAARLHEIGLVVSHSQYQKHGAYLLRNADLAGFTRQEQTLLAALVLAHRRKFPVQEIQSLPQGVRDCVRRLCVLLRLAVLLHRSRSADSKPNPQLQSQGDSLSLGFPDDWLAGPPLTQVELEQEAALLASTGISLGFR
jgi:exopolyphosphatase / guanosine-5'-triphosphate,3'-diphosphate pyrophosphatase